MFPLKKIISRLFFPVPFCVEILLVGLVLLWFTRKQRAGKVAVTVGAALLMLMGNRTLSSQILNPLEHRYPPLDVTTRGDALPGARSGKLIVVLSGGYTNDPRIPTDSQLAEDTLARVAKGVQLYRAMPGSKLRRRRRSSPALTTRGASVEASSRIRRSAVTRDA